MPDDAPLPGGPTEPDAPEGARPDTVQPAGTRGPVQPEDASAAPQPDAPHTEPTDASGTPTAGATPRTPSRPPGASPERPPSGPPKKRAQRSNSCGITPACPSAWPWP